MQKETVTLNKCEQSYGTIAIEVNFSREWYLREMPAYIEAFSDSTIILPMHADILQDHQALQFVDGVIRVPEDFRFKGSDGLFRHGDNAIADTLIWFASRQDGTAYGYQAANEDDDIDPDWGDDDDGPNFRRRGGLW